MKINRNNMLLYAVTDRHWTGKQSLYEQIECALKGGITCLQLREKNLSEKEFLEEAKEVHQLCQKYHVPLIINDNIEIAIQSGAEGVHLGQDDMTLSEAKKIVGEKLIIGVSAHTPAEAILAEKNGADYLGAGAVFGSSTKTNVKTMKKETLQAICQAVSIPVVAIGGINENNLSKLIGTGIDGAAVISAIFSAENIQKKTKTLLKLCQNL